MQYSEFRESIKADTIRCYGRYSASLLVRGALFNRTFRPVITMRLCQAGSSAGPLLRLCTPVLKLLHVRACQKAGMDFAWKAAVGPGLAITHGWGLVVSPGASIGRNVTLFHGVTLARRDVVLRDGQTVEKFPVIEDEVWIGPNATIVGGVRIGRGSKVAAGAFVTIKVPPLSLVVGNPARVISFVDAPDVANPA